MAGDVIESSEDVDEASWVPVTTRCLFIIIHVAFVYRMERPKALYLI